MAADTYTFRFFMRTPAPNGVIYLRHGELMTRHETLPPVTSLGIPKLETAKGATDDGEREEG